MRETQGRREGDDRRRRRRRRRSRCRPSLLVDTGTSGAAELFASALVRQQARRSHRRAHDRPRRRPEAGQAARRQRPLAVDDALSHARRRRRCTKRAWSRPWPSTSRTSSSASRPRRAIRCSTRRSSGSREESRVDELVGIGRSPKRHAITRFRLPNRCILTVRLTPVFSRCRRVAQRLERLLDTQEVGGSSPPVPTIDRRRLVSQPCYRRQPELTEPSPQSTSVT